jgi:SHS2 domain-containing protein
VNAARGHREFDHSGDVGVEAWADTRTGLLEEATLGLLALIATGERGVVVERELSVSALDAPALLVDWLNEVILAGATHGEVYSSVRVDECNGTAARGVVGGEPVDPASHALRFDVKAATYHGLAFDEVGAGFRARVIFDL